MYKDHELKEIANALDFQRNCSGSRVIKFGDQGDKWFILIEGKVSIWVPHSLGSMKVILDELHEKVF